MATGNRPLKLEIGSGEHPCEGGFIHNDIYPYPHIEYVDNARSLSGLRSNTFGFMRAIHVLEHMPFELVRSVVLPEWRRVLVPDGIIELAMPNAGRIMSLWQKGELPYTNAIRDLLGKLPKGVDPPSEAEFKAHAGLYMLADTQDLRFFRWLYESYAELPICEETYNMHRWGYTTPMLMALLDETGFCHVAIRQEELSLHAWASKE